jgi:heterodisulfide reductase subunit A
LLKAVIQKTWETNPARRSTKEVGSGVLVIGGGITGMTSSLALADQGIAVTLVEKEKELGGLARTAYYTLKGSDIQTLLKDMVAKVENNSKIEVLKEAEFKSLEGSWGNFTSTVATNGSEKEITHGALILATGGYEHKPKEYLYGENPHVVTQRELDAMIAKPEIRNPDSVVMIQCVGSRDDQNPYCSRVCCTHAVKNALKLKELNPDMDIYILYRDVRTYGFFEKYYLQARDNGVLFIRYDVNDKPKVSSDDNGIQVSLYDHVAKEQVTLKADLLILSAGVEPNDINKLAETVQVKVNEDGFFAEANPKAAPLDARDRGKFFAGLAHSPMLIEEAICQGKAAAERAAVTLWQGQEVLPETQSFVKELVCTGCGQCVQVCPYEAISLHLQSGIAVVDESLCRGCGTCAGTCRVQAIDIRSYGDLQLLSVLSV